MATADEWSGIHLCHLLPACGDKPPVNGESSQLCCWDIGEQKYYGVGIQ